MNETIYELLNDMEQNLEQYDEEQMTNAEIKDKMKAFRSRRYQHGSRRGLKRRYVAAVLLVLLGAGIVFHRPVFAKMQIMAYHIQDFLAIGDNASSFSKAIDREVSGEDMTVSLKEIVVDEDCMLLLYSVNQDTSSGGTDEMTDGNFYVNAEVSINGTHDFYGAGNQMEYRDGEAIYVADVNTKNVDIAKENYYEVEFYLNEQMEGNGKKIGSVAFVASGKELLASQKRVRIDKDLTMDDGCVIRLEEYIFNPIRNWITVSLVNNDPQNMRYDITLEGEDNLGRKMSFYMYTWDGYDGRMILYYDGEYVDMTEVTSFTVTPYAQEFPKQSGEMNTEMKQVGEEFTITKQ